MLAKLNPELADLAQNGNDLEFGLYYGRRIEFEYEVPSPRLQPAESGRIRSTNLQSSRQRPRRYCLPLDTAGMHTHVME